jgi:hypothetical protein
MKYIAQKGIVIGIFFLILLGFITPVMASVGRSQMNNSLTQNSSITSEKTIVKDFFQFLRNRNKPQQLPFLSSTIQTTCGTVQKTTTINFGSFNEIDVDDNPSTGLNGNDIRVQYVLLPGIDVDDQFKIGVIFLLSIERIGDEIKNDFFELSASIFDNNIILGYQTPNDQSNEIPTLLQLSSFIFIKPQISTAGVTFEINPHYDDQMQDKKISLFSSFSIENERQSYDFKFTPSVHKEITIETTSQPSTLRYSFSYGAPTSLVATIQKGPVSQEKETIITVDSLPLSGSFLLGITPFRSGGGHIIYESDDSIQTNVLIESTEMGTCKYASIENLPTYFSAVWDPAKNDGFLDVDITSQGTNLQLKNSLTDPSVILNAYDIENVAFTAFWNLTNPGDFTIHKQESFHIDLEVINDDWEAIIDAEPTAKDIKITWLTDVSGYLSYDTNFEPLTTVDLLIKGSDLGIRTVGEYFKAEDFELEWTLWPPVELNIQKSGTVDFQSLLIEIFINGNWYYLWPWG